ncbi:hypothetical protein GPECTOR_4g735 [Gonium pectorale]|uniref:Uncharacterized protein n=1 Tax=Gonium pectorale TaxID=33097 RepID=A0A150GXW1_GONPE|nr:hypothetical protein GPECTOR_4g735 [Gonium pectorale]|eukprot:KXZ54669.1 hypothetical protein GPECTOR_4g735 [Gonium pectorale]
MAGYPPEMQRYIQIRAQDYKRLIDDHLQQPGASRETPSKGAVAALAWLVAMRELEEKMPQSRGSPNQQPGVSVGHRLAPRRAVWDAALASRGNRALYGAQAGGDSRAWT